MMMLAPSIKTLHPFLKTTKSLPWQLSSSGLLCEAVALE
jgi:hypothetical protein